MSNGKQDDAMHPDNRERLDEVLNGLYLTGRDAGWVSGFVHGIIVGSILFWSVRVLLRVMGF